MHWMFTGKVEGINERRTSKGASLVSSVSFQHLLNGANNSWESIADLPSCKHVNIKANS